MRALVLVALSGCAGMIDGAYALSGPKTSSVHAGTSIGTGQGSAWREVEIDAVRGLVCRDLEQPVVRTSEARTEATNPNGYRLPMQFFTVLEAIGVATAIAVFESKCSSEGCNRDHFYPWLAPFAADLAWGTYRSFTIHNEIIRSTDVSWGGVAGGETSQGIREPCGVGTELIAFGGGEQLPLHIGPDGWLVEAEIPSLARFIDAHLTFSIPEVRLDTARARALVAAVIKPEPPEVVVKPAAAPVQPVEVPRDLCAVGPDGTAICVRRR